MPVESTLWFPLRAAYGSAVGYGVWYFASAGFAWLVLWVVFHRVAARRRIDSTQPSRRQITREILRSVQSVAIFGLTSGAVAFISRLGWTRVYLRIDDFGVGWLVLSVVVMIVMHDAYFYWTHRWMHGPRWFKRVHRVHHLSTTTTPWTAYAFSVPESVVQAGIGPIIVCTIPTHPLAFAAFMIWQISFNVLGHCGYELYPRWFVRSPLGKVFNTTSHHAQHHAAIGANYGLYFNWWDRLMGTNHPEYERAFETAAGRSTPTLTAPTAG